MSCLAAMVKQIGVNFDPSSYVTFFFHFFFFCAAGRGGSRAHPGTRPGRARARGRPRARADRRNAPRGPARARHAAVARALARDRRRPGASQRPSPAPGPPWGRRGAREHRKKKVKKKSVIALIARGVKINPDLLYSGAAKVLQLYATEKPAPRGHGASFAKLAAPQPAGIIHAAWNSLEFQFTDGL